MKNVLIVLALAAGAYFVFRQVKKKAEQSKLEAVGKELSASTLTDPHDNAVVGWTPYGPKAGA